MESGNVSLVQPRQDLRCNNSALLRSVWFRHSEHSPNNTASLVPLHPLNSSFPLVSSKLHRARVPLID